MQDFLKQKNTIEQKQEEIDDLKDIIRKKHEQISRLDNQVSSLDKELCQTLRESEINSWIGMGDELIIAAETLPKVKGHGNFEDFICRKSLPTKYVGLLLQSFYLKGLVMFTVQVFEKSTGRPAYYKKVGIVFKGFFRGVTKDVYTDRDGEAHFDYDNGNGTIYVQGEKVYEGEISGRKIIYI